MKVGQYIAALERSGESLGEAVVYAVEIFRDALQSSVKDLWKSLTKRQKAVVKEKFTVSVKHNILKKK